MIFFIDIYILKMNITKKWKKISFIKDFFGNKTKIPSILDPKTYINTHVILIGGTNTQTKETYFLGDGFIDGYDISPFHKDKMVFHIRLKETNEIVYGNEVIWKEIEYKNEIFEMLSKDGRKISKISLSQWRKIMEKSN